MTTMTDSREVDFGKKTALYNVTHDAGVSLTGAFSDGEYRSYTVAPESEAEWAAYGLRAFDAKVESFAKGPFAVQPRSSKGPAALPIETALVQVTGKTLEAVRAFLAGKTRKEINALKADVRIAPLYAAAQAAELARKQANKAAPDAPQADLLDGLTSDNSADTSADETPAE
jgi:hypothetical protein